MIEIMYFLILFFIISGFGLKIANYIKLNLSYLEKLVISFAFGCITLIIITYLLGMLGFLYNYVFYALIIFMLLMSIKEIIQLLLESFYLIKNIELNKFFLFVFIISLIINLIGALAPTTDTDGLGFHLTIPKIYLNNHSFINLPYMLPSNWPFSIELIYLFSLSIANDSLAKIFNLSFGILSSVIIFLFCKRFLNKEIGIYASLTFYTLPIVALESGIAYIDLGWTFFTLLSFYLFYIWFNNNYKINFLFLSIFLMGFAASTKTSGPFYFLFLIFVILFNIKKISKNNIGFILLFIVLSALFPTMWFFKNYLFSGNPFHPLFNNIIMARNWSDYNDNLYIEPIQTPHLKKIDRFFFFPYYILFNRNDYGELTLLNPLLIIGLICSLFFIRKDKHIRNLSIIVLFIYLSWFLTSQQSRHLIIFFAIISIITTYLFLSENYFKSKLIIYLLIFSIITSMIFPILYHGKALNFVFGLESRQSYLSRMLPEYDSINFVNNNLSNNVKIMLINVVHGFYLDKDYVWSGEDMQGVIRFDLLNSSDLINKLKQEKITHLMIDESKNNYPKIMNIINKEDFRKNLKFLFAKNNVVIYELI